MPVLAVLFALIFTMTLLEAAVLIGVGGVIGLWPTLGLIFLTAFLGAHLLRQQGLSTLLRARQRMQQGQLPAREMGEGIILAIGGALLLTPGFITDAIGLCCLLPLTRQLMVQALVRRVKVVDLSAGAAQSRFGETHSFQDAPFSEHARRRGDVIDGEYKREE